MWKKITTEDQLALIDEHDTILRYNHPGLIPETLIGSSYGENYTVTNINNGRFTIQLIPVSNDLQQMINAVYPTSTTGEIILQEGNWFINTGEVEGSFIP